MTNSEKNRSVETAIYYATIGLDPATGGAMRTLYLITRWGNNRYADSLIAAAKYGHGVSQTVADQLRAYNFNLVNYDGSIPTLVETAIKDAVKAHRLEVKGLFPPSFSPPNTSGPAPTLG